MSVKAYITTDIRKIYPAISGRKASRIFDTVIYGKGRIISYQEHTAIAARTPGMKRV